MKFRQWVGCLLALVAAASLFSVTASTAALPQNNHFSYCSSAYFADVASEEWYHESVDFSVNAGLMNGISVGCFAPAAPTSRAMVVSVLYRLEGKPAVSCHGEFDDVQPGQWFTDAIAWASENGIVHGYGNGTFGPEDNVSREQLVTILYRYISFKQLPDIRVGSLEGFTDKACVSAYAEEAFGWAISAKLVNGLPDGSLDPQGEAERAQLAAILQRLFLWAEGGLSLPEADMAAQGDPVLINGQKVTAYRSNGMVVVSAAAYASAAGLTLESQNPLRFSGADSVLFQDGVLTVNGSSCTCPDPVFVDGSAYLPLFEVSEALNYPIYTDDINHQTYITPAARPFAIPKNVNVPVLMYHAVGDTPWGIEELFVTTSNLEAQLAYLVNHGYDPIWFEDLSHVQDYDKPVILTFDDGYDDNYTQLFPLLKKYNVKATVFVIAGYIGSNHKATEAQIREMADSGLVSIQSHTLTHEYLDTMNADAQEYELSESKKVLTRVTGRIPYVLCYPTGRFNKLTVEIGQKYYNFGVKMTGGLYNTSANSFYVNRYYIARYTDLSTFAYYISSAGT